MNRTIKKSSVMGLFCCPVGILCGLYVSSSATGEGYHLFPVYAGIAAFITASFFWWLIVVRRNTYNMGAGAAVGALSGVVAHYMCWYVQIISANICYWILGGCRSSLGEPPIDLLNGLWGALALSFWSLLFFGWVTSPIGALIGVFLVRRQFTEEPKKG